MSRWLFCLIVLQHAAAHAASFETLYSFGGAPDGALPKGALLIGKDGTLYGTTWAGGTSVYGTVFSLTPAQSAPWKETVLHNFSGSDGQYPESILVSDGSGALYGATTRGGSGAWGTVFELVPPGQAGGAWNESVLYDFGFSGGFNQNVVPNTPLLIGPGGTFYTTTQGYPGPSGAYLGLIVALIRPATPGDPWTEHDLFSFGGSQGGGPRGGLVFLGGSLFGTTDNGGGECGGYGCGVAYELSPPATPGGTWTQTVLHAFTGAPGDGSIPLAGLAAGPGGVLYGTTAYGGSAVACGTGCGTVFQLTPPSTPGGNWTESVIYSFTGTNGDGYAPVAGVVVGKNGALYGTTSNGGSTAPACVSPEYPNGVCGIVFELAPPTTPGGPWTETVLHSFSNQNGEGFLPQAGLALSSNGVLYGTTQNGGLTGHGTVYAVTP